MATLSAGNSSTPLTTLVETCIKMPPRISSVGLDSLFSANGHGLQDYALPRLEFQMAVIFIITQACYYVLKRLGLPIFISQMIAGLVIGSGLKHMELLRNTEESVRVLGVLAGLGYSFFAFLIGVKMEPGLMMKSAGISFFTGSLSVLFPLIHSFAAVNIFNLTSIDAESREASIYLATSYSITSFPVVSLLLTELKIMNSELGRLALSSALVAEFYDIVIAIVQGILRIALIDRHYAFRILALVVGFVLFVMFVFRPALLWVARHTPEGRPVKETYIYITIFAYSITVMLTKYFRLFVIIGPIIVGLAVPEGPPLGSTLVNRFDTVVSGFFLPLYASTCAMRLNFSSMKFDNPMMKAHSFISVTAVVAKFIGSLVAPLASKMPIKDALALALIMTSKGVVDFGFYSISNDNRITPDDLYNFFAIVTMVVSIVVPLLVKMLYDPSRRYADYRKRNIMDSKANNELQILACIHVPSDVTPVINLLDAICPTRDSPIAVSVLHLIKLAGRSTPLFISHKRHSTSITYSENVILLFNQFEIKHWGAVSADAFTAISPPDFMHDDICNLAWDRETCFIVLPCHRRWFVNSSVESEDPDVRVINSKILERAPCSVGIFLDRGALRLPRSAEKESSDSVLFKVAMIFLGGDDDREALTLARRTAQDTRASLNVINLVSKSKQSISEWDLMLDSMALRDVKSVPYIGFEEVEVDGGSQTATILRSLVQEYDLIIVGRRYNINSPQTSGLEEWSEFPELGVIGDLLASTDLDGTCSALVVQQQKTTHNDVVQS